MLLCHSMERPILKRQEISFDHPDSENFFRPGPEKPFAATPAAIAMYREEVIIACLKILWQQAEMHNGLDYLQVFEDPDKDRGTVVH